MPRKRLMAICFSASMGMVEGRGDEGKVFFAWNAMICSR